MLARSFFIESSSKLLVIRACIKTRTGLISGRIRLLTLELLALEWRKCYTFELEYLGSQLANLDQILCVASLGQKSGVHGNRKPPIDLLWGKWCLHFFSIAFNPILFIIATKISHWLIMGKMMSPPSFGCFLSDTFILACNDGMHKISDEFEFRPDRTTDYGVKLPLRSKKFPIDL